MADKLNVITIVGSLRKGSYNAALAQATAEIAPAGMSIAAAPPWAKLPDLQCGRPEQRAASPASVRRCRMRCARPMA